MDGPAGPGRRAHRDRPPGRGDRRLASYQTFVDWETTSGVPNPFPPIFADYVASLGATPMVTWQPQATPVHGQSPSSQPDFALAQILTGRYDTLIRGWADQARGFGRTVYVRLMHEMNGTWYPWGNGINGNTPAQYVAAWQHIVSLFPGEGVTNVRFVWCASAGAHGNAPPYFPGDPWAAWIAIDGYNRASTWRSFTQVIGARYAEVTAVSALPVMIAETASLEDPLDPSAKADWITSAFLQEIPQSFPRVQAALYSDGPDRGHAAAPDVVGRRLLGLHPGGGVTALPGAGARLTCGSTAVSPDGTPARRPRVTACTTP